MGDENAERGYQQIVDTDREAKDWQQATDAAKEATQKLPNDRGLKMVYAAQLADMGQPDEGLRQVRALLKGTPDDREVYIALSQMYSRLKRWPEAEEALDKAQPLSTKPEDQEYIEFLRGSRLRAAEEIRPGGNHVSQGSGRGSPERYDPELSWLHAGRQRLQAP